MSGLKELPTNPKEWLDFLGSIDYSKNKKAILALGTVAAVGIGAGVIITTGAGKRIKVRYADRHYEEKGVISVVETGSDGRMAAGLPISQAALEGVGDGPEIFVMDEAGLGRPQSGPIDPEHEATLRKLGNMFTEYFKNQGDAA